MSATTEPASRTAAQPQPFPGIPLRDLLPACAAAAAISTPPGAPEPRMPEPVEERRDAA
ncbi:hypothetical protein ACFYOV_12375 [Streptomyces sp. NPDC005931]|uniref:hypothetical protein n=1 Tax=Streptomyces sp. NPDC005931 TaxID=3364737 RepID=UPI00368BBDBC